MTFNANNASSDKFNLRVFTEAVCDHLMDAEEDIKMLQAELAAAKKIMEAAQALLPFLPSSDSIKPGRSAHVDAASLLREALKAYDDETKKGER